MAALSIFNISYRNDANGKPYPEGTRNLFDFFHIKFWDKTPKQKGKGAKNTKVTEKAIPKKVQDLCNKIFPKPEA